jgi:hypothetical protein
MEQKALILTEWSNGTPSPTGSGYGLKFDSRGERDAHFKREWGTVNLYFPNVALPVSVNISKKSFWNDTCRELIKKEIGLWLLNNKMAPWPPGDPPRVQLHSRGGSAFDVRSVTR